MSTSNELKPYWNWQDIAEMFHCGRSKAMLIMHAVGVIHIGHQAFVRASDLEEHIAEHGAIDIKWPQSAARRKEARHARRR